MKSIFDKWYEQQAKNAPKDTPCFYCGLFHTAAMCERFNSDMNTHERLEGIVREANIVASVRGERIGGVKHDNGKAPMSLLDRKALEGIAEVLQFGAAKYAAHNWRGGFAHTRLTDAALRHIFAFLDGEDADPESGLSHIAHAQCCLMFLQRMIADSPELDDRFKPS
ncbi:dATP/dGTP diphosphohydrolase domain-containing protein [Pseudomonas sp.]|uniref:dATP/dGTP diphosphohydrolase domain-containing protein n=1 Tax=Pseudomonas sp. TaxID=306 RepID=UPI003FD6D1CC